MVKLSLQKKLKRNRQTKTKPIDEKSLPSINMHDLCKKKLTNQISSKTVLNATSPFNLNLLNCFHHWYQQKIQQTITVTIIILKQTWRAFTLSYYKGSFVLNLQECFFGLFSCNFTMIPANKIIC